MFSARRETAVPSGTGVFYQAIPAIGADGKNIMKLIPVQMVDGKFFRTVINTPRLDRKLWRPQSRNVPCPPLNSSVNQRVVKQHVARQQVSLGNTLSHPVTGPFLELGNSLNTFIQKKAPLIAPVATNCETSVRLPVNVKSPVLPRGQYLQIPSDAQVRTVPVSQLPPAVKKQIFTSESSSSPTLPSVVYVSPVSTVHQSSSRPDVLSKASHTTSTISGGSKPCLRLVPKVSQRPNSPIKWVIEEEGDSHGTSAPEPLISPSVTSEILRAVAEREVANKQCETPAKETMVSPSNEKGREDALVMCNGKVFFVANKKGRPQPDNQTFKARCRQDDPPATSYQGKKSSELLLRQDTIIIPDESDEVIDLCNDDCSDDLSGCKSTVTHLNEDNVIFVSYIPPKSESGTKRQPSKAAEKQMDETDSSSLVMELKSLDVATRSASEILIDSPASRDHSDVTDGSSPLRERETGQSMLITNVCGAALMNIHDNTSNSNNQQSSSPQRLQSSSHLQLQSSSHQQLQSSSPQQLQSSSHQQLQSSSPQRLQRSSHLQLQSSSPQQLQSSSHQQLQSSSPQQLQSSSHQQLQSSSPQRLQRSSHLQLQSSSHQQLQSSSPQQLQSSAPQWLQSSSHQQLQSSSPQRLQSSSHLQLQSSSHQQLQSSGIEEGQSSAAHRWSDSSSGIFSQTEDTCRSESSTDGMSSPAPQPCPMADHLLRKIFGIAADLKVCLQRIDEVSASSGPGEALQNHSKWEMSEFLHNFYRKRKTDQASGLIRVRCSMFKQTTNVLTTLKKKYPSGQRSHKRILIDIESKPVMSYVEPIDDDLFSTDQHDSLASACSQTQVSVNPNTRRMGRARKRTMCPCCIPETREVGVE